MKQNMLSNKNNLIANTDLPFANQKEKRGNTFITNILLDISSAIEYLMLIFVSTHKEVS